MESINCVCVKCITLCDCLCSSSCCCFSASLIQNIGEFGAKNYFTDHQTANIIHSFRDSFQALKIHGCYWDSQKFEQRSIQAIRGDYLTQRKFGADLIWHSQIFFKFGAAKNILNLFSADLIWRNQRIFNKFIKKYKQFKKFKNVKQEQYQIF